MENKIEDLIKDDFHKREMEPNANSFERLDEKLRLHKATKKRKTLLLFGYAASIIGLIFILQFTLRTKATKIDDTVVTGPISKDSAKLKTPNGSYMPIVVNEPDTLSNTNFELKSKKYNNQPYEIVINKALKPNKEIFSESIFTTDTSTRMVRISITDTLKKSFITKEVSEAELDALLALANKSLNKKDNDSLTINAQRMLYEIEVEINKPLPEKVLLTIKSGTNTIKEIVKSNNNDNH